MKGTELLQDRITAENSREERPDYVPNGMESRPSVVPPRRGGLQNVATRITGQWGWMIQFKNLTTASPTHALVMRSISSE